jgi:hypothetical protein
VPIVLKSGSFNLLEPSGPVKACNGIALPLPLLDFCALYVVCAVSGFGPRSFEKVGTRIIIIIIIIIISSSSSSSSSITISIIGRDTCSGSSCEPSSTRSSYIGT